MTRFFWRQKNWRSLQKKNDKMGMKKILLSFEWNAVDACFLFSPYRIGKSASEIFDLISFCFVFYEDYHDLVFCFEKERILVFNITCFVHVLTDPQKKRRAKLFKKNSKI